IATQKHLSNDNEICVIVVEECSPHLFLFCAKFRSCHENAFLLEEGCLQCCSRDVGSCIPLLILVMRRALVICPRKPHESWCEPSSAIAVLVRICSGDNWQRNSISTASVRVVRWSKTNVLHMSC